MDLRFWLEQAEAATGARLAPHVRMEAVSVPEAPMARKASPRAVVSQR